MLHRSSKPALWSGAPGEAAEATMCLAALCSADRGELLEGPDRSTSELTVSNWVLLLTPGLDGGTWHHHGYKRGMADASTSRVRGSLVFLRLSGYAERATPVDSNRQQSRRLLVKLIKHVHSCPPVHSMRRLDGTDDVRALSTWVATVTSLH